MGGVFINYRAKDNPLGAAGIHDMLARRFGARQVFRDCVSMEPGSHYPTELRAGLEKADVLVAVIGPRWNELRDAGGALLIQRERDWVRWEIARAIERGIPVVPVLLKDVPQHAAPPDREILPDSIKQLANFQTCDVSQRRFGADLERLAARLVELAPALVIPQLFVRPAARTADDAPSVLLRSEYGVVPFSGRTELLNDLRSWATDSAACSVRLVVGPAGCGKTRLAQELCATLSPDGWLAGIMHGHAPAAQIGHTGAINKPLLVVLDDVETRASQLVALAVAISDRSAVVDAPVRLLLLGRSAGNWVDELRKHPDKRVAGLFGTVRAQGTLTLDAGTADRYAQFARAYDALATEFGLTAGHHTLSPGIEMCESLLEIHAAALDGVLNSAGLGVETVHEDGSPLARLLRQDRGHWRRLAKAEGQGDLKSAYLDAISTVATLCRPASAEQAASLRDRLDNFVGDDRYSVDDYLAWLSRLYPGHYPLGAVQPAALGEELVAATLVDQPAIAVTLAATCNEDQITSALTVLGRAYCRRPGLGVVIVDLLRVDLERLVPIALNVASRVERPEEFSRLIATALSDSKISPESIFELMDKLSKGHSATNPVRAETLRALINGFARPMMDQMKQHNGIQETPAMAPLNSMVDRLQGFLLDAATGFLDPGSGKFPKAPDGQDIVPPDILRTIRKLMDWRDQPGDN